MLQCYHICLVLVVIVGVSFSGSHAATSAQSCSMINGQWRCTSNNDPNGNSAVAYSGSDGQMYAGQGTPFNNFNPNFGSYGNPGNFFPFGPQFPFFGRR